MSDLSFNVCFEHGEPDALLYRVRLQVAGNRAVVTRYVFGKSELDKIKQRAGLKILSVERYVLDGSETVSTRISETG